MMDRPANCKAYQVSDQAICAECSLVWDMNDPEPPVCKIDFDTLARVAVECSPLDERLRRKSRFKSRFMAKYG